MKIIIAFAFSLMSCAALSQEHATSIEQCQADLNLWRSQIVEYNYAEASRANSGVRNNTQVMKLSFIQLNDRALELEQCAEIDPDKADSYNLVMGDTARPEMIGTNSLLNATNFKSKCAPRTLRANEPSDSIRLVLPNRDTLCLFDIAVPALSKFRQKCLNICSI
jgi:hypothetical protein